MDRERAWWIPIAGGLVFAIVGIALDFLFSEDPSVMRGIVGGIAFAVTWIVLSRLRRSDERNE